jgi:release factor glutamine methyltransferase
VDAAQRPAQAPGDADLDDQRVPARGRHLTELAALLAAHGFVAAEEEAAELIAAAGGDDARLDAMVQRRLTGEPLAWITGTVTFCGLQLHVAPGVYVPRWHTEELALLAARALPDRGAAIDVCTGSGAVAAVLAHRRPHARIVATDLDERAVACARANGVEAYQGVLLAPVPAELRGATDVVVGVVPYVPTPELHLLQRDTFTFETATAYDGGADGLTFLRRAADDARAYLEAGGTLLLELGGDEHEPLSAELARLGYSDITVLRDEDGDVRGVSGRRGEA